MKIYLKNISHYFLTVDTNGKRKHHMFEEFKDYDLTEVNPILNIGRNKSGATGFHYNLYKEPCIKYIYCLLNIKYI